MLPKPGDLVAAGGDLGFRSDSSALVIVHKSKGLLYVAEILELRPEKGVPLKPSETINRFADRMRAHGATYLVADAHYRESVDEHLQAAGLSYSPAPTKPALPYMRARALLRQGLVRIPNHPRLIQQLRDIQGRPLAGGGMAITSPRSKVGGHGDIVSALVLALYNLGGDEVAPPGVKYGSSAWEEQQREQRRKVVEEKEKTANGPWWKRRGFRQ